MFYIVPKDRSIIKNLAAFNTLPEAKTNALGLKEQTGDNFDIIRQERVWTTQTLDEAHRLSLDIPHIGRD